MAQSHSRLDLVTSTGSGLAGTVARVPSNAPAACITLADRLYNLRQLKKRLHPTSAMAAIYQLTRAVAHAAGLGIMHGSIHPGCIRLTSSSVHVVLTGWDETDPWLQMKASPLQYASPEQLLRANRAVVQFLASDVWSIGMIFAEVLRGGQLLKPAQSEESHVTVASLFRLFGTPSNSALAVFESEGDAILRRMQPQPWRTLLKGAPVSSHLAHLLDAMLDWNPATREPAVGLLAFPFFEAVHKAEFKYHAVTSSALTSSEVFGLVSRAFASHAKRPPPQTAPQTGLGQPRKRRPKSNRGKQRDAPLDTIAEDPLGEVAWSRSSSSRGSSGTSGRQTPRRPVCSHASQKANSGRSTPTSSDACVSSCTLLPAAQAPKRAAGIWKEAASALS